MQTERGQQREDELSPVSVSCMQEYEAVLHGMPINKASRMFSVPYSTLRDRISGKIKLETTIGLVQNRCSRALKKKNEHKGKRFKPAELNNIGTIVIVKCGQCTLFTL